MKTRTAIILAVIAFVLAAILAVVLVAVVVSPGLNGTPANGNPTTPATERPVPDNVPGPEPLWDQSLDGTWYLTDCGKLAQYQGWATLAKDEKQRLYYQFKADWYADSCPVQGE